jgi:hypothetical protein
MLDRKRKPWPTVDVAVSRLLARGAQVALPSRADTLLPQAVITERVRQAQAVTVDRDGPARARRRRT